MISQTNFQYSSRNTICKCEPSDFKNSYFSINQNHTHIKVTHQFFKNSNFSSTRIDWNKLDSNIQIFRTKKHKAYVNQKSPDL